MCCTNGNVGKRQLELLRGLSYSIPEQKCHCGYDTWIYFHVGYSANCALLPIFSLAVRCFLLCHWIEALACVHKRRWPLTVHSCDILDGFTPKVLLVS